VEILKKQWKDSEDGVYRKESLDLPRIPDYLAPTRQIKLNQQKNQKLQDSVWKSQMRRSKNLKILKQPTEDAWLRR